MPASKLVPIKTIKEGLNFRTVDELKKILQLLPVTEKPGRKDDLINAISTYLLGAGLKNLWNELDELQKAAVAEAVYITDGEFQPEQFQAKYGALPAWHDRTSLYRYSVPAAKLDLFFYRDSNYGIPTLIPLDLQAKLRDFVPQPRSLTLECSDHPPKRYQVHRRYFDYSQRRLATKTEEVPVESCTMEQVAQQDLLTVLRLVHLGKVSVSDKTLMPSKATLGVIAPLLQGGDYYSEVDETPDQDPIGAIKPFAWIMLLQASGLASLDGKKLQLTKAGQKAMGVAPATTIKAIWKKWLKTTFLDELRRTESIKGQTGKGQRGLTALSGRRAQVAQALTLCPTGQWVTYDHFKRYMIASNQTFEVSRSPEHLYISEPGYGHLYNAGGAWSILQDTYMRCFLFEYAATLGVIDVAYIKPYEASRTDFENYWGTDDLSFLSRYDGLVAFRLTSLGDFCLGLEESYTSTPIVTENTLRVLPNLDIVMTGAPLNPAETLMMETFTSKTSDVVWKLDRDVVLKAVESGHALKEFYTFLKQVSADTLPKTVEQFFDDCRKRSESLTDQGVARLIECTDASLAALIAHDSRIKKYCQLAGERYLVVPLDQETRFRNALRKLGYSLPFSSS